MSYPESFPYDILQASPEDSKQKLAERWTAVCNEHPHLNEEATRAHQELRKAASRLSYDILLISGVPGIEAVDQLCAPLAQPRYLSTGLARLPFSLALTEAAEDQSRLFTPISLIELALTGLEGYETLDAGALPVRFDR